MGGFTYYPDREPFITASRHYISISVIFVYLPTKDVFRGFGNILTLLDPFSADLWWPLLAIFILAAIVILALKFCPVKIRRNVVGGWINRSPVLNMMSVFLGYSIIMRYFPDRRALADFAKALFIIWSLGLLIVRSTYQGKLYDNLQREYYDTSLDTVQKVLESSVDINTPNFVLFGLRIFSNETDRHRPQKASFQTVLRRLRDKELSGTVYVNTINFAYFNYKNHKKGVLRRTKDRLVMLPNVMYFPKNSYLIDIVNTRLETFVENGFASSWLKRFNDPRFQETKDFDAIGHDQRKIGLPNVLGALVLWGAMLVVSVIVFTMELLALRHHRIRILVEFYVL